MRMKSASQLMRLRPPRSSSKESNRSKDDGEDQEEGGLGSIYMATLLDALGVFMFMPVVAFLGRQLGATSAQQGLMQSSYAFAQFIFTPFLGSVSDVIGRKKVLLITLGGCSMSLFMTAFVQTPNQLILCRTVHGIFASTVSICEAVVADRSTPDNRAQNVAKVMGFFRVGTLIGPVVGGMIGKLGFHTLCLTAGAITLFNVWWLYIQLPVADSDPIEEEEELEEKVIVEMAEEKEVKRKGPSFEETLAIVTSPSALILFLLTFLQTAYVGVFMGIGGIYMIDRFDWDKTTMAAATAVNATAGIVFQLGFTGLLVSWFGESGSIVMGNVIRAIAALLCMSSRSDITPWMIFILNAVTAAFINPCMASLVAGLSGEENRGSVMGVYQSMRSLGEAFGPMVAGQMYSHGKTLPFLFQLVLAILSCLVPRQRGQNLAALGLTELSVKSNAPRPWKRLLLVFIALFLCSGLSPGMLVWVDILAGYRLLFGKCNSHGFYPGITPAIPKPFYCDGQYVGLVVAFVAGNFVASFSILPMLTWIDKYGTLTISTIGGGLCAGGYLLLMLAMWASFLHMPDIVVSFCVFLAVAIADSGAKLAATALQGFAWHFDGTRIVVFLLAMVIYAMSGFIPIALTGMLDSTDPFKALFFMTCLVGAGVIILYIYTPSQQEYFDVAEVVIGTSLKDVSTHTSFGKVLSSANRLLRKNAPKHFFFVVVISLILTWVTIYQGLLGDYGLDLFLHIEESITQGKVPNFQKGREFVKLATLGTCVCGGIFSIFGVVLTELYGWVVILLMIVALHGLSFTTINSGGWGGQFFAAALASVCREMVLVIQGKYLSCYTPPKKLAAVTCLLSCYVSFGQLVLLCCSMSMIQLVGKEVAYLILVGVSGVAVILYAVYCSFVALPKSPVMLREEERELCESYGCSSVPEVLTIMGFDSQVAILQLLSSSDRDVQSALLLSINADLLEENLYQQSLSSLVSMLRRGFAWTQGSSSLANMRMLQGSPGSFAITPHLWSQFWKRQVDTTVFNHQDPEKDYLRKDGGKSQEVEKIVRVVRNVLIRVIAGEGDAQKILVQCSEESPDGRRIEKLQLPTTKRSESDSLEQCVKRNLMKYAMGSVKIDFQYDKPEVVEEPYESPTYPGVITLYRKEVVVGTVVEEDREVLSKICLPSGGEWLTKDESNYRRKAMWMTEEEARSKKVALNGRSQALTQAKEAKDAKAKRRQAQPNQEEMTESVKQELHISHVIRTTGNIIKSLQARKYSKSLFKHLRSGNKANLLHWMRSESADGVCEAFEDLEAWVQDDAKYLMKVCLELLSREDLVELLKKRVQLKRLIIFMMKYELRRFQSHGHAGKANVAQNGHA